MRVRRRRVVAVSEHRLIGREHPPAFDRDRALRRPITRGVRMYQAALQRTHMSGVRHEFELLFATQEVADVRVPDLSRRTDLRVLDEDSYRNPSSGPAAKDVPCFPAARFAGCARVAPEIEHVYLTELVRERLAHAVGTIGVEPSTVAHIGDDAPVLD